MNNYIKISILSLLIISSQAVSFGVDNASLRDDISEEYKNLKPSFEIQLIYFDQGKNDWLIIEKIYVYIEGLVVVHSIVPDDSVRLIKVPEVVITAANKELTNLNEAGNINDKQKVFKYYLDNSKAITPDNLSKIIRATRIPK